MEASVVVWRAWTAQIKALVPWLHGHQCRALALLTLGLVRAGSVRLPVVAEALAPTSAATLPSIERRLARVLANPRLPVGRIWAALLPALLAGWRAQAPRRGATLVLDLTPIDQRASLVYLGVLIHTRLLPLAWQVLPGATPWPEPQWDIVARLMAQVAPHLHGVACTLVADRGLSGHPLVNLCGQQRWHSVLRLECSSCCQPLPAATPAPTPAPTPAATPATWQRVDTLVRQPGQHWYGAVRVWKERPVAGYLSAVWTPGEHEPWYLLSDQPAGARQVATYRLRMRVEATFQDTKTRGWDLEGSRLHDLARLERLLLGLALALWWTTQLAAACLHQGQRRRLDRADRRDKGLFRLGRQWAAQLLTRPPSRQTPRWLAALLPFRSTPTGWQLHLRF